MAVYCPATEDKRAADAKSVKENIFRVEWGMSRKAERGVTETENLDDWTEAGKQQTLQRYFLLPELIYLCFYRRSNILQGSRTHPHAWRSLGRFLADFRPLSPPAKSREDNLDWPSMFEPSTRSTQEDPARTRHRIHEGFDRIVDMFTGSLCTKGSWLA